MSKFSMILLFLITANCLGQFNSEFHSSGGVNREWVNRFNGPGNRFDIATTMRLDGTTGVIVYGNTASLTSFSDITAIKYSPSGILLWQSTFNGFGNSVDETKAAVIDAAGNSYVTGFTADTNQVVKIVTLKINASGVILWSKVFLPPANNQGIGISITNDNTGNTYTCGYTRRANGSNSIVLIKYSTNGDLLGSVFFNKTQTSSETPVSVCVDNAGFVYILASSNAIGGVNDILMLKYSSSLNLIWQNTFSGNAVGNDIPVQMLLSNDNRLVVAAAMNNLPGGLDYGVFRFDTSSALAMQYFYNGTGNNQDIPYAITTDTANNIFVTGSSRNSDTLGSEDFFTMKIDPTAFLVWEKRYNGNGRGFDYGTSIAVDKWGNVFAGGTTDKHDFHQQYALLKYGPTGDLLWLEEYSKIEYSEDFIYTTLADNNGNIYVTGISFDSTTDYDIATIKYSEVIGIGSISTEVPRELALLGNYPNPFNPVTKIKFQIPQNVKSETSNVKLIVSNLLGEAVAVIINDNLKAGIYEAEFDGSNFSSGVYFCTLSNGKEIKSMKIILIK
ncbi:MAG: SBBP repeat-containing protein [Ignavibacteria bacterium]